MNRQAEINAGLRKPPTEVETLTEQQSMLMRGIQFMRSNRQPENDPNMIFHLNELKKVESRLAELKSTGKLQEISGAQRSVELKNRAHDAEMAAIANAWSKQNPGKTSMDFGGPETQKLFEQYAAAPPSAEIDRVDKRVCGYCGKSSAEKLLLCSQCKSAVYCGKECQKLAWKGHKKFCQATGNGNNTTTGGGTKQPKLPLTWEQLEAFGGAPAVGKVGWVLLCLFSFFSLSDVCLLLCNCTCILL